LHFTAWEPYCIGDGNTSKQAKKLDTATFIKQLDTIIDDHRASVETTDQQSLVTRSIAAIHRISGSNSAYAIEVKRILDFEPYLHRHTSFIVGIVQALRDDLNAGYIQNLVELAHGEVFADFLEMALHLSDSGYKDAAAVIAGSTLESHIRELCHKHIIPIEEVNSCYAAIVWFIVD